LFSVVARRAVVYERRSEEIEAIYRDSISLGGSGWTNQTNPWAVIKNGLVLLSLARRKRDIGAAAWRGDRM
jgi:hypothetical protein